MRLPADCARTELSRLCIRPDRPTTNAVANIQLQRRRSRQKAFNDARNARCRNGVAKDEGTRAQPPNSPDKTYGNHTLKLSWATMHQIRFQRARWEAYSVPRLLNWILGALLLREGKKKRRGYEKRKRKERTGKRKGGRKEKEKGGKANRNLHFWVRHCDAGASSVSHCSLQTYLSQRKETPLSISPTERPLYTPPMPE